LAVPSVFRALVGRSKGKPCAVLRQLAFDGLIRFGLGVLYLRGSIFR
jgi:hypothetical protein